MTTRENATRPEFIKSFPLDQIVTLLDYIENKSICSEVPTIHAWLIDEMQARAEERRTSK